MAANHAAIMRITSRASAHNNQQPTSSKNYDNDDNELKGPARADSESKQSVNKIKPARSLPTLVNLDKIESVDELNYFLDPEVHYANTLKKLETNWAQMTENLDQVLDHLEECSHKVTNSSVKCLEALLSSVNFTCDQVDEGIKASYQLMATCDSIKKDMTVVTKFAQDVKSLKKGVETLETLYQSANSQLPVL